MEQQIITFAASSDPVNEQQWKRGSNPQARRFSPNRYQRFALMLILLLVLTFTVSLLLVTSGTIPRILHNGRNVSLIELNTIRARGEATFCVQQVSAASYFLGMSFDYQCFDTEAESDQNVREVQAQLRSLESP